MSEKVTQEEFEKRAREIHGDKYDYSYEFYKGMNEPYNIMCEVHGLFKMKPACHIHQKQKCKQCYLEDTVERNRLKHKNKIHSLHGNKYYVKDWLGSTTLQGKLVAACNDHGDYTTTANSMINTSYGGCPRCKQLEEAKVFINKAVYLHGTKYSYKEEDYICSRTLMDITCNTHNIVFKQRPSAHLQGQGCPKCGQENANDNSSKSCEEFLAQCKSVHGDRYDYSKTNYKRVSKDVIITCKEHGDFSINPSFHLSGGGCKKCKIEERRDKYLKLFLTKMKAKPHYNHLDFSKVVYINNSTKVEVYCKDHKEKFFVTPNKLLDNTRICGCRVCGSINQNRWTIKAIKRIPNIDKRKGLFYTGKIEGLEGIKIGICSDEHSRKGHYSKDLEGTSHRFNYLNIIESDYLTVAVIEVVLKKIYRKFRVKHDIEFGGKNEVFDIKDYTLISDILQGRFDMEIAYVAKECEHDNDPVLLSFVSKLKNIYNI